MSFEFESPAVWSSVGSGEDDADELVVDFFVETPYDDPLLDLVSRINM